MNPTSDDRTPYTPGQPTPYVSPIPGDPEFGTRKPGDTAMFIGQPVEQPRKKSRLWLVFAVVAGIILVVAATVAVTLGAQRGTPAADRPQTAWDREQQAVSATTPDPTPAAAATPAVSDITLTLKTTDKQCFGSAGCQLTLKVNAAYDGPTLDADDTWEITYEIKGVDDGPLIGTFEMTGDQYTVNEEDVSTKSSKTKLTVKVTSVEKVGL